MFKKFAETFALIRASRRPEFGPALITKQDRALAHAHFHYHDHGILRGLWANTEEIAAGVWRSNQPDPDRIATYKDMGIKAVLNLRGTANRSHYLLEKEACEAQGIELVSIALSAKKAAPKELYLTLLDIFDSIERPFVVHCKSGADRTGLASVFYLLHVENQPLAVARKQLALRYVHLRWLKTGILDDILDAYEQDLKGLGPMSLRTWLSTYYDSAAITAAFRK